VIACFLFQFWIQGGQIIKIRLSSSRDKTKSLNLFFSVLTLPKILKHMQNSWAPSAPLFRLSPRLVGTGAVKVYVNLAARRRWMASCFGAGVSFLGTLRGAWCAAVMIWTWCEMSCSCHELSTSRPIRSHLWHYAHSSEQKF